MLHVSKINADDRSYFSKYCSVATFIDESIVIDYDMAIYSYQRVEQNL